MWFEGFKGFQNSLKTRTGDDSEITGTHALPEYHSVVKKYKKRSQSCPVTRNVHFPALSCSPKSTNNEKNPTRIHSRSFHHDRFFFAGSKINIF